MTNFKIALTNGKTLVAEASDSLVYKEIYIGIKSENDDYQPLVTVREKHTYNEKWNIIPCPNQYEVNVYDNPETPEVPFVYDICDVDLVKKEEK